MLKGKNIIVGITGSIAAYKAAYLVRGLVKKGCEVQVIMTPAGKEFITPVTLSALTGKPVISEFFTANSGSWNSHVDLGLWADAVVIAPATASTIGKMANGIADNMLITTYLSAKAPVFVAPAMDLDMFAHPSTKINLDRLRSYGNHIIEPASGELASHLIGKGRMEEPERIIEVLDEFFDEKKNSEKNINNISYSNLSDNAYSEEVIITDEKNTLAGKNVMITAGPTFEKIDPVRFIGNYSSGKMGYAIAEEAAAKGANVTLISGPVNLNTVNSSIKRIDVESAVQMHQAALDKYKDQDIIILCAAVADYRPESVAEFKMKRKEGEEIAISLVPNPDIAADLGTKISADQILVGFALETNDEENNALLKIKKKNLDFIVLNSLNDAGAGFKTDTNKITIIDKKGNKYPFSLKSKQEVARDIIEMISYKH